MYKKQRIEALSDGIFAIAMTLLVLELKVPASFPPGHIWRAIEPQWEEWLGFAITFGLAARFWTLQHDLFDVVESIGRDALICTFVFLGLITVLPYTTSLLGTHFTDTSVLTLYFAHELAIAAALILKLELCSFQAHVRPGPGLLPLRLRLYGMGLTLIACLLSVRFVPIRWLFIAPLALGALERRLSARLQRSRQKAFAV